MRTIFVFFAAAAANVGATPAQVREKRWTTCTTATGLATSAVSPVMVTSATAAVAATCTPVSWTPTAALTTEASCPTPFEVGTYCGFINPEDACAPQPDGYGPKVVPDTPGTFAAYQGFHDQANAARSPSGYIEVFKNLSGAVESPNGPNYLGYYALHSYDVTTCASHCNSVGGCTGFNVYIERDPSVNPDHCSCSNPSSITNYKCALFSSGVEAGAATNHGQYRDQFEVVIVGSNGYQKTN